MNNCGNCQFYRDGYCFVRPPQMVIVTNYQCNTRYTPQGQSYTEYAPTMESSTWQRPYVTPADLACSEWRTKISETPPALRLRALSVETADGTDQ